MNTIGNLSTEQLRTVIVALLQNATEGQLNTIISAIPALAIKMGFLTDPAPSANSGNFNFHGVRQIVLSDDEKGKATDVVWDLIIEGVIRPGLCDGLDNNLPFFHVTQWGKSALKEVPHAPYDPDGYLKRLQKEVPNLDPIILTYLNESLHTFRIGCLLSSTIALGCATEKALLLLIAAYGSSLPQQQGDKFRTNTEGRMIKRQFDEFQKMLDSELRARLSGELNDGLDIELTALFNFIRNQRNDAGHPTGKEIDREAAYANLVIAPVYFRKVYDLMEWMAKNPKK